MQGQNHIKFKKNSSKFRQKRLSVNKKKSVLGINKENFSERP